VQHLHSLPHNTYHYTTRPTVLQGGGSAGSSAGARGGGSQALDAAENSSSSSSDDDDDEGPDAGAGGQAIVARRQGVLPQAPLPALPLSPLAAVPLAPAVAAAGAGDTGKSPAYRCAQRAMIAYTVLHLCIYMKCSLDSVKDIIDIVARVRLLCVAPT
jgi:hypothetical protein